eukprot:SAG31_NODE_133_length_23315_cov_4.858847_13_plen_100_part_00
MVQEVPSWDGARPNWRPIVLHSKVFAYIPNLRAPLHQWAQREECDAALNVGPPARTQVTPSCLSAIRLQSDSKRDALADGSALYGRNRNYTVRCCLRHG